MKKIFRQLSRKNKKKCLAEMHELCNDDDDDDDSRQMPMGI